MSSCRLSLALRRPELFHEDLENEFRASTFGYFCYMTKVTIKNNQLYEENKTRKLKKENASKREEKKGKRRRESVSGKER